MSEYTEAVYAYLDEHDTPVECSRAEWWAWWEREGNRCQIEYDRVGGLEIEMRFQGCSFATDWRGPLFWEVTFDQDARRFATQAEAHTFYITRLDDLISLRDFK